MNRGAYAVEFTSAARKQLEKLDASTRSRILKATSLLATNPRPPTARRLVAHVELWRVRVGDHRVVYTIDGEKLVVAIVKIGHRSSVYRDL